MKKLKSLDNFQVVSESVVGKYTTMSMEEIKIVQNCTVEDLGSEDTPKRSAIVKAIETAMKYFETKETDNLDIKSKIITAAVDDENRTKLFNLAKTFVSSLVKIHNLEMSEIEPVTGQIENIIG